MSQERTAVVVLTTVADEETGDRIARTLVEEHLAACVSRTKVRSTYRWRGKLEDDSEALLVIKSFEDLCPRLERRLAELSSYEVPEFIVLDARGVGASYLAWMSESCPPRA
ncbi:MAG: divalent-cation tolerance protein CutA [Deltaproteobacteria bacterium]|nr:MAG: divalent-cation tolerance protein CutA [Deltaproteobacteria bacterium]